MKKYIAIIMTAMVLLSGCGSIQQETASVTDSIETRQYDDLTEDDKELLDRAGLTGTEGGQLTNDQCYILDGVHDMLSYIEEKYEMRFTVHYFHSMSVLEDYDTLYVYPEWSDKALDLVTVERRQTKADTYAYTDDYAAAYCRQTLETMAVRYFLDQYGEGRAKIFMTMGCDVNYLFDGTESPEELLQKDAAWGNGLLFLSEADVAREELPSVLDAYGEAFRATGVGTALGVFLMQNDVFEEISYANYDKMYANDGMIVRYDVTIGKDEVEVEEIEKT